MSMGRRVHERRQLAQQAHVDSELDASLTSTAPPDIAAAMRAHAQRVMERVVADTRRHGSPVPQPDTPVMTGELDGITVSLCMSDVIVTVWRCAAVHECLTRVRVVHLPTGHVAVTENISAVLARDQALMILAKCVGTPQDDITP